MNSLRLRIKLLARLALAALLVLVLSPTLAHAILQAHVEQDSWADICAAQGHAAATASDEAATSLSAKAVLMQVLDILDHACDCSLDLQELAPQTLRLRLAPTQAGTYLAPLFLRAPRTLHAWRSPLSRAPPLTA